MHVNIFDCYGKLIIGFEDDGDEWDGKYNGYDLPCIGYWLHIT